MEWGGQPDAYSFLLTITASPKVGLTAFRSGTWVFLSLSSLNLQVQILKPKQNN